MKKMIMLIAMILMSSALVAQTDLTSGEAAVGSITIGAYIHDASGNQDGVREFDGRDFGRFGIEELNSYGYNGPTQYWLNARDLIIGEEDFSFSMSQGNTLGLTVGTSKLTHRLFRVPSINPYIASEFARLGLAAPVVPVFGGPAGTGDTLRDFSPGVIFRLNRRVNNFDVGLTPSGSDGPRFIASWWQELEGGTRQQIFRSRAATTGVIANSVRSAAATPIDRSTNEGAIGTDLRIGNSSVLNYRYSNTEYSDDGTRPGGVLGTIFALNSLTRFDSSTTANSFRARSRLTDRLFFTGTHSTKDRKNLTSHVPATATAYVDAGTPLRAKVTVENTNLGLTFLATDALTLTGRWRRYEMDNEVPAVFRSSAPAVPDNQTLSREVTSTEVNATYTGIPKAYLKLGFERRDVDRELSAIHPPHPEDEFEHPFSNERTESDIIKLGARYYPTPNFSIQANLESWNISDPGYAGTPTDRQKINVNATYMVKSNLSLYGDFSQNNEKNKQTRVEDPSLATPPIAPPPGAPPEQLEAYAQAAEAYAEERENAAGQHYKNDQRTTVLGAWYGLSPKVTLDAYWSKSTVDAEATLIFGNEAAYLPHLAPDFAPFKADNNQWSFGATYAISPRWRLNGRFANSNSDGKTLITVLPGGLGPTWTPVDVESNRWTLGVAYDVSARDRLLIDFSVLDWNDNVDSSQNGTFNIWRFAWSTGF